jgi:hypothetical protein
MALRDSNRLVERLQIEKGLLLEEVFPRMVGSSSTTVNVAGPTTNLAIGFDRAAPHITYSGGIDSESLLELIHEIQGQLVGFAARAISGNRNCGGN